MTLRSIIDDERSLWLELFAERLVCGPRVGVC